VIASHSLGDSDSIGDLMPVIARRVRHNLLVGIALAHEAPV